MALFESRKPETAQEERGTKRGRNAARRPVDTVEDMRRRARHRLIGACLLVLVAIVAFPMMFDAEPRPDAIDAQVRVAGGDTAPARGQGNQVALLAPIQNYGLGDDEEVIDTQALSTDSKDAKDSKDTAQQAKPRETPRESEAKTQSAAAPVSLAAQRAQQAKQRAESEKKAEKQPEKKPAEKKPEPEKPKTAEKKPAEKPAAKPAEKPAATTTARADTKTDNKPAEKKPAEKPAEKPAAAEKKPTQVAAATPAATQPPPPVKPPPKTNAERDDAARARALLEGRSEAPTRFIVQVGAFSDDAKVREVRQKIEGLGLRTYIQVVETGGNRATRVRVGPFTDRGEADRAANRIKGASMPAAILSL